MARFLVAGCLASASLVGSASAVSPSDFVDYNLDWTGNGTINPGTAKVYDGFEMAGKLYVPDDYDPTKSYAVVMHMHGSGERGQYNNFDNYAHINDHITGIMAEAGQRDFLIYAPQSGFDWAPRHADRALAQLGKLTLDYAIDPSKIYLMGLSMGGGAARYHAQKHPGVFAATVAVAGVADVVNNAVALTDEPIWLFHAKNDQIVNVSNSQNLVNRVRNAQGESSWNFSTDGTLIDVGTSREGRFFESGTLRYTEYASGKASNPHNSWDQTYDSNHNAMYDWLFAHGQAIPTLGQGMTTLVDFDSDDDTTYEAGGSTWNSTLTSSWGSVAVSGQTARPVASAFLKTRDGVDTQVMIEVTGTFSGSTTAGVTTGSGPAEALGDGWTANGPASVTIHGLNPGEQYLLEVFGSIDSATQAASLYSAGEASMELQAGGNASQWAQLIATADSEGTILFGVRPGEGSATALLNALSVTGLGAVPEPTSIVLIGVGTLLLTSTRRGSQY